MGKFNDRDAVGREASSSSSNTLSYPGAVTSLHNKGISAPGFRNESEFDNGHVRPSLLNILTLGPQGPLNKVKMKREETALAIRTTSPSTSDSSSSVDQAFMAETGPQMMKGVDGKDVVSLFLFS